MNEAIVLENVTKCFGTHTLLEDVSLKIPAGEMVALTGPSGCGKTTLLNMIGLIEPVSQGQIRLFGKPVPKVNSARAARTIRSSISYLFQNFALVESMTVRQNLNLALAYSRLNRHEKAAAIQEALDLVGLQGMEDRRVYTLSGGQQQRVSLARTILKQGNLILADEPTGALDAGNRDEVLALLRHLNESGKTIVIVTHDPVVAASCHRVINLS